MRATRYDDQREWQTHMGETPRDYYSRDKANEPSLAKFCRDCDKAAAKVRPKATSHDEFMRLLRLELVAMGYEEFI